MKSIKTTARIAGVLYLIIFFASPLAFMIGKGSILVPGDAAATANNLMASKSLFRAGIAAETIVFIVETILAAILFVLLKPVSQSLSLAAAFSRLGEAIVQAVNLLPFDLGISACKWWQLPDSIRARAIGCTCAVISQRF